MKNRKVLILIVFIILIAAVSFILNNPFSGIFNSYNVNRIYDNESKISEDSDSYNYMTRRGESRDNQTKLEFVLTGMETLWDITVNEEASIEIEYNSVIEKGKLKVVLISPSNNITNIFEQSQSGVKEIKLEPGTSRIKIVGLDAVGNIQLKFKKDELIELKAR